MKFELTQVWGFNHALRGMRNPMNSWFKSDSEYCEEQDDINGYIYECSKNRCPGFNSCIVENILIGQNDLKLAQQLIRAGSEHCKFLRQIFVSVDITAPLYWWKEADTYKVGTVANSMSTMHKISTTPISIECFEIGNYNQDLGNYEWTANDIHSATRSGGKVEEDVSLIVDFLENLRQTYLETKDKRYWYELIRWLPESWLQMRTMTMNYQVLRQICFGRRVHKLDEWRVNFVDWIKSLPYAKELIMYEGE